MENTKLDNDSRRGLLFAFEGIDGTGKSTQINMLAEALKEKGFVVITTREPTNSEYGKKIRQLYVSRENTSKEEELRLFVEDRKLHVKELITPALEAGKVVLTDRYYLSTAAYQGAAGLDFNEILAINESFAPIPDLVFLLDIPVKEAIDRIQTYRQETLNAFEQEDNLLKVSNVFHAIERDYIVKIDAQENIDTVHTSIMVKVDNLLGKRNPK